MDNGNVNARDISGGVDRECISLENDCDLIEVVDFVYVRTNIPGTGTNPDEFAEQFDGCKCIDDCGANCSCTCRFQTMYDEQGCLIATNDNDPLRIHMQPIVECNNACTCIASCCRRIVQNGLTRQLQVFRTQNKGFGLRALDVIHKHSFVCEYAGEVISYHVAKHRSSVLKRDDCNYIVVIREHLDAGNVLQTYVDPTYIGNVGRFINHSCEPNLVMLPVRINNSVPKLALFALEEIATNTELCYDYSGGKEMPECDSNNRKTCFCQSENCRGFLPFDTSLFVD